VDIFILPAETPEVNIPEITQMLADMLSEDIIVVKLMNKKLAEWGCKATRKKIRAKTNPPADHPPTPGRNVEHCQCSFTSIQITTGGTGARLIRWFESSVSVLVRCGSGANE